MADIGTPVNQGNPNPAFQAANQPLQGPPPPDPQAMPDQMPTTEATAATVGQTQQPQVQGPSHWGRIVHTLLGTHNEFVQTPNGPVAQQAENKPGQLFRSILAGALLGGATAGENAASPGAGSGWVAAGRGAGAAAKGMQEQQQNAQKQAQQQFQNQQEVSKDKREETMTNAQVAHFQAETAALQRDSDFRSKDWHAAHNKASAALYDSLKEAGGVAPVDGKLPETLTAKDFAQRYTSDMKAHEGQPGYKGLRQAPAGYVRNFIDQTDATKVQWNGINWIHPDGTPVDMTDNTSIQVLDVPIDAMKTRFPMKNDHVNAVLGQDVLPAGGVVNSLAPLDLINLAQKRLDRQKEEGATALEERKVQLLGQQVANESARLNHEISIENANEFKGADKEISEHIAVLQKRLADPFADPKAKDALNKQVDDATKELKSIREKLYPNTKIADLAASQNTPVLHPEIVNVYKTLPEFDPQIAAALGNMTTDEIVQNVNASTTLSAASKAKILHTLNPKSGAVAKPAIVPNAMGRAVGGFAQKVAGAAAPIINALP